MTRDRYFSRFSHFSLPAPALAAAAFIGILAFSVAPAAEARPPRVAPQPNPHTAPAIDPGRVIYWVQQAAHARPAVTAELAALQEDLQALRGIADTVDGPARKALSKRIRAMEGRLDELEERLEQALPPVAFAGITERDFTIVVPVPAAPIEPPPPPPPAAPRLMPREDYAIMLRQMKDSGFDSSRTESLRAAMGTYEFSVDQTAELIATYGFDSERMVALDLLLPRLIDPERAFRLMDAFSFDSDKATLRQKLDKLAQDRARAPGGGK